MEFLRVRSAGLRAGRYIGAPIDDCSGAPVDLDTPYFAVQRRAAALAAVQTLPSARRDHEKLDVTRPSEDFDLIGQKLAF